MTTTLHPFSTATGDEDQRDALALPVRDPAWFPARQWQTGGFRATDGGTPVHVTLAHVEAPIQIDGRQVTGPVEPVVEARKPAPLRSLDTATRVRLAAELVRRLRDGLAPDRVRAIRSALATAHPLTPATPQSALASLTGRLPDPAPVYELLSPMLGGAPLPSIPGMQPADAQAVERAARGWCAWVATQIDPVTGPDAWNPHRLEYSFGGSAQLPDGLLTLRANGYDGTGVDWHTFDRDALPPQPGTPQPTPEAVRPVPVSYPGMPEPGVWPIENGDVSLEALRASSDPAQAILATFAHEYANDWFLVTLTVAPGASRVTALNVTDTFGITTNIPSTASIDGETGPWRLWELTRPPGPPDAATGIRVFPPPAPPALEGPTLEDVLIARDEMANLAWLIELTTADADGAAVDRYRRWLELRPAGDPAFNPGAAATTNAPSYRLGTPLPDFWYPLVSAPGPLGKNALVLADVPPEATGVSDDGVRGTLIPHAPDTTLADEEASRTGTRVTRRARLTATPDGIMSWTANIKGPGQGESASGLRFDTLG